MIDLTEKFNELNLELIRNFAFFVPFDLINNQIVFDCFDIYNIEITQELVDKYIDQFLFIDNEINIKKVESYDVLNTSLSLKIIKLESNLSKIIQLKDSLGTESFNYLYNNYSTRVNNLLELSNCMVTNYDTLYPDSIKHPKNSIIIQKNIFDNHFNELEKKIGIKSQSITNETIFKKIATTKTIKFRDLIKHENKLQIEEKIKNNFSDLKGLSLRYLIEFLEEKNLILIGYGDKTKIYRCFIHLFDNRDIGTMSSIFDIKIDRKKDIKYIKAKEHFLEIFKDLI